MFLAIVAIIIGLIFLVLSADKFVDGAAATASYAGIPKLLVGMLIIGFGTSAPEMMVSAIASYQGNPGIALGNAYGSNISNIALILGVTAVLSPIAVDSKNIKTEMLALVGITLLSGVLLKDGFLGRVDGLILLGVLSILLYIAIKQAMGKKDVDQVQTELPNLSKKSAFLWMIGGLIVLIVSSRILVWGAVFLAKELGVSDLIIGLTIVAIGTSLPELAASIMSVKKGEHNLAIGNVIGSNIFNTLAVVGIAAGIHPLAIDPHLLSRDWVVMTVLTIFLLFICLGKKIGRGVGAILLTLFFAYTAYIVFSAIAT